MSRHTGIDIKKSGEESLKNKVFIKSDKYSDTIGISTNGWQTNCVEINEEVAKMAIDALTEYLEIKREGGL